MQMGVRKKIFYTVDELNKDSKVKRENTDTIPDSKKNPQFKQKIGSFMRIRKRRDLKSKPNN
jgi:hypothetical protein